MFFLKEEEKIVAGQVNLKSSNFWRKKTALYRSI